MSKLFAELTDDEEDDEPCHGGRAVLRVDTASPAEDGAPLESAEPKAEDEDPGSPSAEYADDFAPLSPDGAEYADGLPMKSSEEESATESTSESEPSSAGEVDLERRNAFMQHRPKREVPKEPEATQLDDTQVALPQGGDAEAAPSHSEQVPAVGTDAVLGLEPLVASSIGADDTQAALPLGSDAEIAPSQSAQGPLSTGADLGLEPLVAPPIGADAADAALPQGSDAEIELRQSGKQGPAVAPLGTDAALGVTPIGKNTPVPELSTEEEAAVCLYLERVQARSLRMSITSGAELALQESRALPDAVAELAPRQAGQDEVAARLDEGELASGQTAQEVAAALPEDAGLAQDGNLDDVADDEDGASDEETVEPAEAKFARRQFHGVAGTGAELAGWLLTGTCAEHKPAAEDPVEPADHHDSGHEQAAAEMGQEHADHQGSHSHEQVAAEAENEVMKPKKKKRGAKRYRTCIQEDINCGLGTWEEVHEYCNSQEAIDVQRGLLEGAHVTVTDRLQRARGGLRTMTDTEDFLELMREKGDGSVGIAWRRYFDTDGDGALSFKEFCLALNAVHYVGDVLQLWQSFGGSSSSELGLEVLDADSAEYITHFYNWSVTQYGGPLEMFAKFDDDGSDSLEKSEFADGLRADGFFEDSSLPIGINTVEKVLDKLYRLLDTHNTGVVQPDQLLFLERNPVKRAYWEKVLRKKRDGEFGTAAHDHDDQPNKALEFLKDTGLKTTNLGKQHWKMMPYNPQIGGPPPRELGPQPLFKQIEASPLFVAKQKVPRFLREFRHAKQQGKLIGKAARLAREACMGDDYVSPVPITSQSPLQRPGSAPGRGTPQRKPSSADRPHTAPGIKAVDVESAGDVRESAPAAAVTFNTLPPASQFASLGLSPGVVGSAKISGRAKNRRAKDNAQKTSDARKAYCGSFVKASPKSEGQLAKLKSRQPVEAWKEPTPDVWLDKAEFSPTRYFDFFTANKSLAMWDHYDIARNRS